MKPDYKNWLPKGMIYGGAAITLLFLILFIIFGLTGIISGTLKTVIFIVLLVLAIIVNRITVLGTIPLCVFLPVAGLWIAALPQEQDFFLLMPEKWQSCQLR